MALLYPITPLPNSVSWIRHRYYGVCESQKLLTPTQEAIFVLQVCENALDSKVDYTTPLINLNAQISNAQRLYQQYLWRVGLL